MSHQQEKSLDNLARKQISASIGIVQKQIHTSNYEKFQSKNPLVQKLLRRFFAVVAEQINRSNPQKVLDAGCGEGETLSRLGSILPRPIQGVDINPESISFAAARHPHDLFTTEDLMSLSYDDGAFDLVLCLEVLEHIENPERALRELARVSSSEIIISVPYEPFFQLGSLARGKYLSQWGNHPEHINHWNPKTLQEFLSQHTDIIEIKPSLPWIVARCRVQKNT